MMCASVQVSAQHKREFRGAWIQAVNGQWVGLSADKMKQTLTYQLNELQKDGVNAIIFQSATPSIRVRWSPGAGS